jgi:hypothetical protein
MGMTIKQSESEALRQYRQKGAKVAEPRNEVGYKMAALEPAGNYSRQLSDTIDFLGVLVC